MLSARLQIVILLAVVIFLCCPVASRGQESQVQDSAALAAPVEEPPGLAELSSGQVVVTYENAELTIKSHSAPLIEVLHAVCSQIGAELDAPSVADETVLGIIGPGPTREV